MIKKYCDICRKDMTNEQIAYVPVRRDNNAYHRSFYNKVRNADDQGSKAVDEFGREIPDIDVYMNNRFRLDICSSCKRELKDWINNRKAEIEESFKAEEKEFGG